MATTLIKNLKLPRVPNVRLNFTGMKSNFSQTNVYLSRSCRHLGRDKFISRCYSTAVPQRTLNEEPVTRNPLNRRMINIKDINSVDEALERIDWIVKGSGRVLMQNVVEVLSKINTKQLPTSTQGLYLLRCCKYVNDTAPPMRIQLVNQIWNRFQELGIKFDTRHYNALLEAHIYNDFVFDPAEFLTSMEEQSLEPSKDTCLLLMKKYCKDGNLGGASEILEYMKEKGFPANEEVFNNLIRGHLNNKDFAGAKDMIEVMRSLNLYPTEDTYAIFACGYAAEGDKDHIMSYLLGQGNRVMLSDRSCLKVIEALAVSRNDHYIDDVLGLMKSIYDYRQECINTAVELVHKGCINAAYKLIIASADDQYNQGTNIFIRQLIKAKQPASQVLDYCKDISSKGLNDIIIINALRAASDCGNIDCATILLKERLAQGHPVRNSSFFPLFTAMRKAKSPEGVWLILKSMNELGIPADFTTFLDNVYPTLGVPNSREVIQNVKESGHFIETATDSLFVYYCHIGKIDLAFELLQTVPVNVSFKVDFRSFLDRYKKLEQGALNKYFQVLKYILEKVRVNGGESEAYQGKFLAELISNPNIFEVFLRKIDHENLAISEQSLNICETILKQHNPPGKALLWKFKDRISRKRDYTIEEEEQQINYLLAQKSCRPFLIDRILHHSKLKNIDRVSELITLFEKMGFFYTPVMLANLMSLYAYTGDLERTKETFSKLKKNFPHFKLDIDKILDFSSILIQYTKYDDALDVLKSGLSEPFKYGPRINVLRSIRKLTNTVCETGDIEFVKNVQNLVMPLSKEFGAKRMFLEPSIDVHLHRNDFTSALDEYRKCIINHRIPACLNNFLKKCITASDKMHLQKVIDLTVDHVGRNIALIELAVAFVETGYSHKAVSVMEKLGHEVDPGILDDVCMRLCDKNKLADLEQFISITKGLTHIDREKLYHYLFKACAARNDYEKVIDVFNRLREDGIEPSSKTIENVTNLLKQNNQPIPICLLSPMSSEPSELSADATKTFLQYLQAGDVEFALKEANELKKGYIRTLSFQNLTDLVDLCLQNNCTEKLSSNTHFMSYIIENAKDVLTPILEKYSESGDVEKLISVANFIPDFSLKNAHFNSYFCKAFCSSGKHEELLSYLEERCDSKRKMFSIVAFEELLKFPEFEDRVLKLAVKYHKVDYLPPIAVVWANYFIKRNYDKANELYKSYAFPVDRIDPTILRAIRQNEDLHLGEAYINFIKHAVTRSRTKERAFGTVLDILVLKQKYDEAISLVLESEKLEIRLHQYYQSSLITLKNALERENKPVPFRIPSEELSPDSSSSDSE